MTNRFVQIGPNSYAIQDEWLRVTQNPTTQEQYPRSGDIVTLRGHHYLPDGKYLVTMVEEFEPPFVKDANGRDIRISVVGMLRHPSDTIRGLNGERLLKAIIK